MKKVLLAVLALANVTLIAQTTESVSMGASYADDVYYSFANGVIKTESNTNWDFAFTTGAVDVSILINEGAGVELFVASNDTAEWSTIDTTGMTWTALRNSPSSWAEGAFNANGTGHPNYGWGTYNSITHNVVGTTIYVAKLADGSVKKIFVESMLTNGDFTFRVADLDNMNAVTKTVSKSTYATKNFFYYDATADLVLDREPAKTDWDMVITRYQEEVIPGSFYPVTGVLINGGVTAAKAADTDTTLVDYRNFTQTDSISIIGSDWKSFDMGTFSYVLDDSLSYFVEAQDGNLYKLIFKSFAGSSTGDISFTTSIASSIGIIENNFAAVDFYPNPATDAISININGTDANAEIISLTGAVVAKAALINGENRVQLQGIAPGMYVVRVIQNNQTSISRVVIK